METSEKGFVPAIILKTFLITICCSFFLQNENNLNNISNIITRFPPNLNIQKDNNLEINEDLTE